MQTVKVIYKDGVFVPTKPISELQEKTVFVAITEGESKKDDVKRACQGEAEQYFINKFPNIPVENALLELIGIL